jgi:hypothetical protein
MVVNDIQDGMDVFDTNGEKIGSISEVYSPAMVGTGSSSATHGFVESSAPADEIDTQGSRHAPIGSSAIGSASATAERTAMTDSGYFKVGQGGILGIGTKDLYIPFSAVDTVVPADNVTVRCTKDECIDRYASRPDFLDRNIDNNS